MKTNVKAKESSLSKTHRLVLIVLFVSTLISLVLVIMPQHKHICHFLSDFASHHIFITLFFGLSLIALCFKFLHEYLKTNSMTWAGINTYEYIKINSLKGRWKQRLARLNRRVALERINISNEDQLVDVLTDQDERSKRYRDLLNAMSLGNNFKHKVKLHLMNKSKTEVIEATVWYANATHVTLKGGRIIPVKIILRVEY